MRVSTLLGTVILLISTSCAGVESMKKLRGEGETRVYTGSLAEIETAIDSALAAERMQILERGSGVIVAELPGDLGLLVPITMKAPVRLAIFTQELQGGKVQVEIAVRAGGDYGGGVLNPRAHINKNEVRDKFFTRLESTLKSR